MLNASQARRVSLALFAAATVVHGILVFQGFWHLNVFKNPMAFWPAAGFAVWLVTRFGNRLFFAIVLGELLAYQLRFLVSNDQLSWLATTTAALANGLTALVAARMWHASMTRWRGRLGEFSEAPSLLLAALVAPVVSAVAGVGSLLLTGGVQRPDAGELLLNWWLGDSVGVLVVLPLLMAAPAILSGLRSASAARHIQGVIVCALMAAASWWVFWFPGGGPFLFVLLPLLLLATAQLGQTGALVSALVVATVSFSSLAVGRLPFQGSEADNLLIARLFLMTFALAALVLRVFQEQGHLTRRTPLALLLVGWTLSAWLFGSSQYQDKTNNELEFSKLASNAEESIGQRMSVYTDALRSGSSFLLASDFVSRSDWKTFAESLDLPRHYPGIQGVGVIYPVPLQESELFLQRVRADGAPEFTIHAAPGGSTVASGEQWLITYLEPEAGNLVALGVNLASEPARRLAAATARDTGETQMTSRITLIQDSLRRPGFLLLQPTYRHGKPLATVAQRRAALVAWVYAPFVTEKFIAGALGARGKKLNLHMFEQGRMDEAHLVFSSVTSTEGRSAQNPIPGKFERMKTFNLAGQVFTLAWNRGQDFVSHGQLLMAWMSALIALSPLILTGWFLSMATFRERAERLVEARTAALRESEFRWKFAIEGSGEGLWDWNLPSGTVFRSSRWKQMLGYADDEVGSALDDWKDLIHPDHRARVAMDTKLHLDGATPQFMSEYQIACKDGRWAWVLDRGVVVARDSTGKPMRVIGTLADISKRKLVETELWESHAKFKSAFDSSPMGMALVSLEGNWTQVNSRLCSMLGYSKDELMTLGIRGVTHPEDLDATDSFLRRIINTDIDSLAFAKKYLTKDGRILWAMVATAPVRNSDGQTAYFVSQVSDITEQREAQESIGAALREKEAGELRLRTIIDTEPECVKVVGPEGQLLEMNAAGLRMLEADSVMEASAYGLGQFILPDYRVAFSDLHTRVMAGESGLLEFEIVGLRGTRRWLETHAAPLRDAGGRVTSLLGVTRDISERKLAEASLQSSLREKEALLREVHHRVKNNLQVINSLLRLESGRNEHVPTRLVLGEMQRRIQSMALLHESLYRSGTFAAVDLGTYLGQLASQSFRALNDLHSSVELRQDLVSVQVAMDQALPCGLLVNELISNCLKHGFPDGRSGHIHIQLHPLNGGSQLRLRVSDTGVGLPDDFEDRRSHSLGLQLVSDLVLQLQGTLEVQSVEGSSFTVTFAVRDQKEPANAV